MITRWLWPKFTEHSVLAGLWALYWTAVVALMAAFTYLFLATAVSTSDERQISRLSDDAINSTIRAGTIPATPLFLALRPERIAGDSLELSLSGLPLGDGLRNRLGQDVISEDRDILVNVAIAKIARPGGDGTDSEHTWTYRATNQPQPPIPLSARPVAGSGSGLGPPARNSLFAYPFDTWGYGARFSMGTRPAGMDDASFVAQAVLPCFLDGGQVIDASARCDYAITTELSGYRVSMKPDSFLESSAGHPTADFASRVLQEAGRGQMGVHILVQRSIWERAYILLVLLTLIATIFSVWHVLYAIRRLTRPPTGQILVWVAALTFAVIAVRNSLPVPLGVGIDYLFMPLLLFTALATVELSFYWTTRHDYGEGQMPVLSDRTSQMP